MKNPENEKKETPRGKRPGGNNLQTPPKPPSAKLKKALGDLNIIIMIMVVGNNLRIYIDGKSYKEVKGTLKSACEICNLDCFMRTHKSYLANLNYGITFKNVYENYEMMMTNIETVIIGRFYKKEFNEKRKLFKNIVRQKIIKNKPLVT